MTAFCLRLVFFGVMIVDVAPWVLLLVMIHISGVLLISHCDLIAHHLWPVLFFANWIVVVVICPHDHHYFVPEKTCSFGATA